MRTASQTPPPIPLPCAETYRAPRLLQLWQKIFDFFDNAIEVGHLVAHANEAAFGTRPIIAGNIDEQRVVHLANVFDG
jgi:hypothetical protein